jgi:hypothetical protein
VGLAEFGLPKSRAFWSRAFWSRAFWSRAFWSRAFWSRAFWSNRAELHGFGRELRAAVTARRAPFLICALSKIGTRENPKSDCSIDLRARAE